MRGTGCGSLECKVTSGDLGDAKVDVCVAELMIDLSAGCLMRWVSGRESTRRGGSSSEVQEEGKVGRLLDLAGIWAMGMGRSWQARIVQATKGAMA